MGSDTVLLYCLYLNCFIWYVLHWEPTFITDAYLANLYQVDKVAHQNIVTHHFCYYTYLGSRMNFKQNRYYWTAIIQFKATLKLRIRRPSWGNVNFAKKNKRPKTSRGYGRRLMFQRSCVWFLATYTGWTFFTYLFVVKFVMCVRKDKNKWKRCRGWHIFCIKTSHDGWVSNSLGSMLPRPWASTPVATANAFALKIISSCQCYKTSHRGITDIKYFLHS